MKTSIRIDSKNGIVTLNDGSKKIIDNYVLELEDRLIKIHDLLRDYEDVNPLDLYTITGETLFVIMDILENRK